MPPPEAVPECDAVADELASIAVGSLNGRNRTRSLAHVEECPSCAADLAALSAAAESLLALVPEVDPPAEFSRRVTARFAAEPVSGVRHHRRRFTLPVVAAAIIGAGVVLGSWLSTPGPSGAPGVLTAVLRSATGADGSVTISAAPESWAIINISGVVEASPVTCELTLADGSRLVIGRYDLHAGYGSWAAPVADGGRPVRSVAILNAAGAVVASARFAT